MNIPFKITSGILFCLLVTVNVFSRQSSRFVGIKHDTLTNQYKLWSNGGHTFQVIDSFAAFHHMHVEYIKFAPEKKIYGEFNIKERDRTLNDLEKVHNEFRYLIGTKYDVDILFIKKRRRFLPFQNRRYFGIFRRKEIETYMKRRTI